MYLYKGSQRLLLFLATESILAEKNDDSEKVGKTVEHIWEGKSTNGGNGVQREHEAAEGKRNQEYSEE